MNIIPFLIILPLVIWGIGVITIVINSLKGIIKSKAYEAHKVAMLKLTIGLVMLVLLAYYLFLFYCYTFYSAFLQTYDIDKDNFIFSCFDNSPIKVFSEALETGYVPYIPVLIIILGFSIHFYKIQKSWHNYFRIVAVLGLVFLYNTYLAYQIGSRLHEMDIDYGIAELDSTYGLADIFSDVKAWTIVICGVITFVILTIVLDTTINTYKYISCKQRGKP